MWFAVVNNIPEIALGLCWSSVVFWTGRRFERKLGSRGILGRIKDAIVGE